MSRSKVFAISAGVMLLCGMLAGATFAQEAATAKPSALQSEMLVWFQDAEDKLTQLAEATPEAKYSWSPGKGVRSTGDVFMHVAAANYGIPSFWGVKPPEGFDFMNYEKSLTKKADIQQALKASFAHMKQNFMAMPEADLDKPAEFFGMKTTVRGGYLLLLSHAHEHLGQSIAYARTNGIVPPWTAKQMEAAKAAEEKKKTGTK
jgi:uncharacterized damage-inducible protein DinB